MTAGAPTLADRAARLLADLAGPAAVLRPDQLVAIESLVVDRARVLVVQRTGWGKSAVYWIATRLLRDEGAGPTLVVSPLLALMRDQVAAAARMGIAARTINSTNVDSWREIEDELAAGSVDVLLISPERLNNPSFRTSVLPRLSAAVGMLVIDEAHCISDWGHDFRPDYRRIATVLASLGPGVPVLATTATANERVTADVAAQIGPTTLTLRGTLDRESLRLAVVALPTTAERLAWLAEEVATEAGAGIVYCLTVAEVERVASFLADQGLAVAAYSGDTPPEQREQVEADLAANRLRAVVATSALGMGYDKPDLAFVIHLGSPSSPIAYYQQVGRAGRAIATARAVLLPAAEDSAIWAYFDATASPPRDVVERVVRAIETEGPVTVPALEEVVNLRRGRLEALLKVLDVEGAVERQGSGWVRTTEPWAYDEDRLALVDQHRKAEQVAMRDYATTTGCRMRFLRDALDDPDSQDCGRCDTCTGATAAHPPDVARTAAALAHLRGADVVLEPRKQWPRGMDVRRGNIKPHLQVDTGRALAFADDPGWGQAVRAALEEDGPLSDELLHGLAAVLKRWPWVERPTSITSIPSRSHPVLVRSMAERLAALGNLPLVEALRRSRPDDPPQRLMANSWRQCTNVVDAFVADTDGLPPGPVLVVDDTWASGWTMTVAGEALRGAGSGPVLPLVLWRRP